MRVPKPVTVGTVVGLIVGGFIGLLMCFVEQLMEFHPDRFVQAIFLMVSCSGGAVCGAILGGLIWVVLRKTENGS